MDTLVLKSEPRTNLGTKYTRRVRAIGKLPAVIYGHGEPPESIALDAHEVGIVLGHGGHLMSVDVKGTTKPYLIKAVQFDHLQHNPIHLDLARVDLHERVKVKVGIELRGTPKGLGHGGILEQVMADVEVECLVTEIPDMIRPNVAHLHIGESLHVKELTVPPGVKVLADPEGIVASIRVVGEEVVAPTTIEGETPVQPEVISRGKEEKEGEAEAPKK